MNTYAAMCDGMREIRSFIPSSAPSQDFVQVCLFCAQACGENSSRLTGLFGIGGGIVKGPLMLEMGVLPEVSSATSATMILLTSSAATISYFIFSALNINYAIWLFFIGLIFTVAGQIGVDYLVKQYGRPSLIVFVIGTVVALSAVAMGIEGGKSIVLL